MDKFIKMVKIKQITHLCWKTYQISEINRQKDTTLSEASVYALIEKNN